MITITRNIPAWYDDPELKAFYLQRVQTAINNGILLPDCRATFQNGNMIGGGIYAVLARRGNHELVANLIAVPESITMMAEAIFDNLPVVEARLFALDYLNAIPVGADMNDAERRLREWLLYIGEDHFTIKHCVLDSGDPLHLQQAMLHVIRNKHMPSSQKKQTKEIRTLVAPFLETLKAARIST